MELSILDKKLAMDSRDIAKLTKKRHADVLRDIRFMYEKLNERKNALVYKDKKGEMRPYYLLNYEDTLTLLTGYSVKLRAAVVKRWAYLEKHYQSERKKSIEVRHCFTDELKDRGYSKPNEYIQTTTQMKKPLGITHKKKEMTAKELKAIYASEAMASLLLDDEYGYFEVNPICVQASVIVNNAMRNKKVLIPSCAVANTDITKGGVIYDL